MVGKGFSVWENTQLTKNSLWNHVCCSRFTTACVRPAHRPTPLISLDEYKTSKKKIIIIIISPNYKIETEYS